MISLTRSIIVCAVLWWWSYAIRNAGLYNTLITRMEGSAACFVAEVVMTEPFICGGVRVAVDLRKPGRARQDVPWQELASLCLALHWRQQRVSAQVPQTWIYVEPLKADLLLPEMRAPVRLMPVVNPPSSYARSNMLTRFSTAVMWLICVARLDRRSCLASLTSLW